MSGTELYGVLVRAVGFHHDIIHRSDCTRGSKADHDLYSTRGALAQALDGNPSAFLGSSTYVEMARNALLFYTRTVAARAENIDAQAVLADLEKARSEFAARRPHASSGLLTSSPDKFTGRPAGPAKAAAGTARAKPADGNHRVRVDYLTLYVTFKDERDYLENLLRLSPREARAKNDYTVKKPARPGDTSINAGFTEDYLRERITFLDSVLAALSNAVMNKDTLAFDSNRRMIEEAIKLMESTLSAYPYEGGTMKGLEILLAAHESAARMSFAAERVELDFGLLDVVTRFVASRPDLYSNNLTHRERARFSLITDFATNIPQDPALRIVRLRRHADDLIRYIKMTCIGEALKDMPPQYAVDAIRALEAIKSGRPVRVIPTVRPMDRRIWLTLPAAVHNASDRFTDPRGVRTQGPDTTIGFVENIPGDPPRPKEALSPETAEALRLLAYSAKRGSPGGSNRLKKAMEDAMSEILGRHASYRDVDALRDLSSPVRGEIREAMGLRNGDFTRLVQHLFGLQRAGTEAGKGRTEDRDGREGKPGRSGRGAVRGR